MQRTEELKKLRPNIPTIAIENATTAQEQFQNRVLRPILKFQNDLLVALFQQYIIKRKGIFNGLSREKKLTYIQQAIQKDQNFRNLLVGSVVGQFTLEEYQFFATEENKLTKRMMEMCVQRLQDQLVGGNNF